MMTALRRLFHGLMCCCLVAINLAIASPAQADLTDDICWDEGQPYECCTFCVFFCSCSIDP